MTARVTGPDGRWYLYLSAGLQPVYVAEQPRSSSAADTAHTGFALLCSWLAEERPGADPLPRFATIRNEAGETFPVHAGAVCGIEGLAGRRILPKPPQPQPARAEVRR
jgi:hypothetical protein